MLAGQRVVEGETVYIHEVVATEQVFHHREIMRFFLVKIDAEGAEVEILEGMENILSSQELRAIFMEVHFSVLQERGLAKAPAEMEKKLISKGFHVEWVDFSHLVAQKKKQ